MFPAASKTVNVQDHLPIAIANVEKVEQLTGMVKSSLLTSLGSRVGKK